MTSRFIRNGAELEESWRKITKLRSNQSESMYTETVYFHIYNLAIIALWQYIQTAVV
jgi:hypothetical protein